MITMSHAICLKEICNDQYKFAINLTFTLS